MIVYPTETFYALGCSGFESASAKNIYRLKKRSHDKPLLLLISQMSELYSLTEEITEEAIKLAKTFWPGPLTLIFKASKKIPLVLTGDTGKIGIRIPGCEFTRKMIARAGVPVVGTSANITGEPGALDIEKTRQDFGDGVSLYLNAGKLGSAAPSTVVDTTKATPEIIREGKINKNLLLANAS